MMLYRTAILTLCLSTVAWAQASKEEEKAREAEAKERLANFKTDLREAKNSESNIALAITRLGEGVQHKRIVLELKRWLANRSLEIMSAAADALGRYQDDPLAMGALLDAASRRRDTAGAIICLRNAGGVGHRKLASKFTRFYGHKDVGVAKEAVEASGKTGAKISVDALLALLRQLESIRETKAGDADVGGVGGVGGLGGLGGVGGVGGIGGVGGGNVTGTNTLEQEQNRRKTDLTPATNAALAEITGERYDIYADWVKYWRKAKRSFKERDR